MGIGILVDKFDFIFDMFQQVDGFMICKFGGIGLGFFIFKRLVNLMGGDVWVKSEYGKGSKFYFMCVVCFVNDDVLFIVK